jgi:Rrf2 family protein
MQIKVTTIYAIQALREFRGAKEILSNTDIAKRLDISISYATEVNRKLTVAGFLEGVRGPTGGHKLAKDLTKIPIAELIEKIDGGLLEDEAGETEDMLAIRATLRGALTSKGWGRPVSSLL